MKKIKLSIIILAIWLILQGVIQLTSFSFSGIGTVMAVLALAAGVLLLLDR
jgi:hypothetical protein